MKEDVGNAGFFGSPRIEEMLRKAVQRKRRCALKTNLMGGGLQVAPGSPIESSNGVPYPTNVRYDECYTQGRPGALTTEPNVALAQTPMAGGAVADFVYTTVERKSRKAHRKAQRKSRRMSGGCGCMWGKRQRGGQCPYKMAGGQCPYKMTGGNKGGFGMDVAQNIGGDGPIAEPVRTPIPCDTRAGANNPYTVGPLPADPRAYGVGYSATANTSTLPQKGGELSERIPNFTYSETMMGGGGYGGNAFDPACYKAPGSQMPVYPATSVGFHFTPSTEAGAALPDGVTAFNEVVQHAARLGGARKSRKAARKASKKAKKARKASKKAKMARKSTKKARKARKSRRN